MTIRCLPARVSLAAALAGLALLGCDDTSRATPPPIDAAAPPIDAAPPPPGALQIKTLSNRADLVSGGDVLVEIVVPPGSTAAPHVTAGTRDVSDAFVHRPDGRTIGLVTGLADGATTITADIGGKQGASLAVTNHKIG